MTAKKVWHDSDKLVVVIRELEKHGNVTHAMKTAKAARGWVYGRRKRDRFFRDAFEAARACGIEVLKDEAHRRAYKGIEEPVYHQGEICGHVRKYSDTLLMFLIKQADTSYREHHRIDHGNANPRPFLFQMKLHPDAVAAAQQTLEPELGDRLWEPNGVKTNGCTDAPSSQPSPDALARVNKGANAFGLTPESKSTSRRARDSLLCRY